MQCPNLLEQMLKLKYKWSATQYLNMRILKILISLHIQ